MGSKQCRVHSMAGLVGCNARVLYPAARFMPSYAFIADLYLSDGKTRVCSRLTPADTWPANLNVAPLHGSRAAGSGVHSFLPYNVTGQGQHLNHHQQCKH